MCPLLAAPEDGRPQTIMTDWLRKLYNGAFHPRRKLWYGFRGEHE
jgi:hypothetical protein